MASYQPHDHQNVVTHPPVSAEIVPIDSMSRQSPKPPPSPSPSKSSMRSTSGTAAKGTSTTTGQTRGLGLLPSPSFEDVPRTASPKTVGFDVSVIQGQGQDDSAVAAESVEQPAFQPFFTLINDSLTSEHYHPTVHYIFADDEEGPEMMSEGVLRSLQKLEHGDHGKKGEKDTSMTREHILVLDVDMKPSGPEEIAGYEVTQVQSLSADWQVRRVDISNAPTMSEEDGDRALMLKIEGKGPMVDDRGHEMGRESLEDLVTRYQRSLEGIRAMVDLEEKSEQA